MVWFKVDDGFWGHPKVMPLSPSAVGLWILAGTWSSSYLTDGAVPVGMVARFGATLDDAGELVAAGLWHEAEDGFQFHEWAEYQPTKEDVEAEREAARERMRAVRARRKGVRANSDERSDEPDANKPRSSDDVRLTPTQPVPSRPEPSKEGSVSPRKRGQRIPEPFLLTVAMREWAAEEVPLVDVEDTTRRFVDYWRAKSGKDATKVDWVATWRNWLRRASDDIANKKLTPMERAMRTAQAGRQVAGLQITSLDPKEITQ